MEFGNMDIANLVNKARKRKKNHKSSLVSLKREKDAIVDAIFRKEHHRVFEKIDCLDCANCCKTTGPLLTKTDRNRIARFLQLSPIEFKHSYLLMDEDGDYIFKSMPCPFLNMEDNRCGIYEVRPKACKKYPHTDQFGMKKINKLTLKNAEICPAVFEVLENITKNLKK